MDVRDIDRGYRFTAEVDASDPPSLLHDPDPLMAAKGREDEAARSAAAVVLQWDQALDDHGCLRRCPVCGCRDLFVKKHLPQVTGFAAILLGAGVVIALLGFDQAMLAVLMFFVVAMVDAAIFFYAPRKLVCYRCGSTFREVRISPHQRPWESGVAERYRAEAGGRE